MDELTRRAEILGLTSEQHRGEFALQPNELYLVKLRAVAVAADPADPGTLSVHLELGFSAQGREFDLLRKVQVALPVVSDADDHYGQRGRWYEQVVFVRADEIINTLQWRHPADPACHLIVRCSPVHLTLHDIDRFADSLADMQRRSAVIRGTTYQPYIGVDDARAYLDALRQSFDDMQMPVLAGTAGPQPPESPRIGVVGDDLLAGLIGTSFNVFKIGPETIPLVESGAMDALVVQGRAVGIAPHASSLEQETQFLSDLSGAMAASGTPILEVSSVGPDDPACSLRGLAHAPRVEVQGHEHEFAQFAPIKAATWSARTIGVPCASDLYQSTEFQDLAGKLAAAGFTLALSESNFDHVPVRTWERFKNPLVKAYGRLQVPQQAELFRSCGFVVLPGRSLRPLSDLVNLAVMALMSGSLPVIVGRRLPAPFDEIVETVASYLDLHAFLTRNCSVMVRERLWLSRFRRYMEQSRHGRLKAAMLDIAGGAAHIRAVRPSSASAELICVSKRPENLPAILDNFRRQAHPDLGLHLIWNVPADQMARCVAATKPHLVQDMRVSVLDETNNIGSCLNHGIRHSVADYWFKMDDDDYYGSRYVSDSIDFYKTVRADVIAKPFGFIYFALSDEVFVRRLAAGVTRTFPEKPYLCGATLSGARSSGLPAFSTSYRNSCDSKWMESVREHGFYAFASDPYNFVTFRGDVTAHTWQISEDDLKDHSTHFAKKLPEGWIDAD